MSKRWVTTKADRKSRKYIALHRKLMAEVALMRETDPASLAWWVYASQ